MRCDAMRCDAMRSCRYADIILDDQGNRTYPEFIRGVESTKNILHGELSTA